MELLNLVRGLSCTCLTDCLSYSTVPTVEKVESEVIELQSIIKNRYGNIDHNDILLKACIKGDIVCVNWLINNKVNIHFQNDKALELACENNYKQIVKLLLINGADISANNYGSLKLSIKLGHDSIVKTLLNYGYEFNNIYENLVELATDNKKSNILRMLYAFRNKFLVNGQKMEDQYFIDVHLYCGTNAVSDVFVSVGKKND
ncbi:ankyrin repeat domain containing protein [Tupanvirus deep ocean]|uniref:Ankyrin repeat domain containing protein n=2 Tax=Tupanvirus TaxID=2094720 RepID=A0AC62A7R6_9VIRU|nr:ankyrin repeat domain containing protein [Tupanvirus deep ocean]QKU33720.1 ankyrin repeat domain containing protein [Tupanvirus deep ocean]